MNKITKTLAGTSIAFFALLSLALTFSVAQAADLGGDYGWVDTGSYETWAPSQDSGSDYGWVDTGYQDTWAPTQDTWNDYGWVDTGYQDTWAPTYDSYGGGSSYGGSSGGGFSMPSFGGSGGGYSMPSFGSANASARANIYNSNTNVNTNTNTCTNNSCNYVDNSVTDNSIKISEARREREREYQYQDDCYGYEYGYQNQGYGYNQGYNYDDCYVAAPIAYNTTPYISLSQTPYTGLDLGPMGEVLYWTFLVLWCLGAAYLIVVKRVQNKLVGFLNGFLFGSSAPVAHAAHTSAAHTTVVAHAPLVEEGIDPFIQSQIKRS